ncbi:hypothetical protein C8R45DRAFT_1181815, partial [Mycena sanguinolenta]
MSSSLPVDALLEYTRIAASMLQDIPSSKNVPFLSVVSQVTMQIIPMVQAIRANRDRCIRMTDEVHQVLCILTSLCFGSGSIKTPKFLDDVGRLAQNLQKFHGCLRSQQELGKIRRLFKQPEITAQLEACEAELQGLLELFKLQSEFLELLASQSITQGSETGSVAGSYSQTNSSISGAFSLVPAAAQIFHGRESELKETVAALIQGMARVAIMGPGGMGKTTLALAALHHEDVEQRYPYQHFISCESATGAAGLISTVGLYLGLEQSSQLSRAIVEYFQDLGPAILVLDNMETPWEPLSTRTKVEEFLSLLADVSHLALLITMRGAERPGKINWTRPFLPPLEPISTLASRQTFIEIADNPMVDEEAALAELIELTGSLPLAVVLMANVASFEGYLGALSRWKTENIALLSDGFDRRSNLEKSISLSLTSPRIKSNPHTLDLLSLLSLLPDGVSEDELTASEVPIPNILQCRSVLLQTTLAFLAGGRMKVLTPVRDYIRNAHPLSAAITRPLCSHFLGLLNMYRFYSSLSARDLFPQVTSHLGNIQSL